MLFVAPLFFLSSPFISTTVLAATQNHPLSMASIVSIMGAMTTILTVVTGFLGYRLNARKAKLSEVESMEKRYRERIERLQEEADKWRIAHGVLLSTPEGRASIMSVNREYDLIYKKKSEGE